MLWLVPRTRQQSGPYPALLTCEHDYGRPGHLSPNLLGHNPARLQGSSTGRRSINQVAVAWRDRAPESPIRSVVNKAAGEQDGSLIRQQGYEVALGTRLIAGRETLNS